MNVEIPGLGTVSIAPGQQYIVGPISIVHYDPQTQTFVPDPAYNK